MQKVKHDYKNISPIFDMIERLYTDVSEPLNSDIVWRPLVDVTYPLCFKALCDTLQLNVPYFNHSYEFVDSTYPKIDLPNKTKNIIVCFSGGKDSTAVLLHYKKLGYKVYAYHLHGINKVYYDEYVNAEKVCKYLDIPYYSENVSLSGKHSFFEHPLKNYIIANGAIQYGIRKNIGTNISFGNFYDSSIADVAFDVCGGDCKEMWDLYDAIIGQIIPDFHVQIPLKNNRSTFTLLAERPELFTLSSSCISPYRFKKSWKERTEKKYGVVLADNRCGCCWKDAMEYMYLADHDMVKYNSEYYIHCIEILANTVKKEMGESKLSLQDVWDNYMPYESSKSKERKTVEYGTYQSGKIKCTE